MKIAVVQLKTGQQFRVQSPLSAEQTVIEPFGTYKYDSANGEYTVLIPGEQISFIQVLNSIN